MGLLGLLDESSSTVPQAEHYRLLGGLLHSLDRAIGTTGGTHEGRFSHLFSDRQVVTRFLEHFWVFGTFSQRTYDMKEAFALTRPASLLFKGKNKTIMVKNLCFTAI